MCIFQTTGTRYLDAQTPDFKEQATFAGHLGLYPCSDQFLDAQEDRTQDHIPQEKPQTLSKDKSPSPFLSESHRQSICALAIPPTGSAHFLLAHV